MSKPTSSHPPPALEHPRTQAVFQLGKKLAAILLALGGIGLILWLDRRN